MPTEPSPSSSATPPSSPAHALPVIHSDPDARRAFTMHDRLWQLNRYVYPVVSRRSKGISIGINLNPDKVCNFDCIYCSVDRKVPLPGWASRTIDLDLLRRELTSMLDLIFSGGIYQFDPFDRIPEPLRRVNDIAFSGDGEPTTCPQFDQAVRLAAELKETRGRAELVKLVLITNATMFHRPAVRETLAFLDAHNGEIWAKLDAGTAAYYDLVDRTSVPFARVLENLRWCCQIRPTVIQSLFMRVRGEAPPESELDAYIGHLAEFTAAGNGKSHTGRGGIKLVQLYTVARQPTESWATPLTAAELEAISARVQTRLPGLTIEIYP